VTPAELEAALKPLINSIKTDLTTAIQKASEQDWDGASVIINLFGFLALLVSIWKLSQQTKANQESVDEARKQRLLELIPIVVVETYVTTNYHHTATPNKPAHWMRYRNIGRGTAFHINVEEFECKDVRIGWSTGQYLQANADLDLPFTLVPGTKPAHSRLLVEQIFDVLQTGSSDLKVPLNITYKDAVGVEYTTTMTLAFERSSGVHGVHYHDTLRDNESIFDPQPDK
jgi:hypothetical protein